MTFSVEGTTYLVAISAVEGFLPDAPASRRGRFALASAATGDAGTSNMPHLAVSLGPSVQSNRTAAIAISAALAFIRYLTHPVLLPLRSAVSRSLASC